MALDTILGKKTTMRVNVVELRQQLAEVINRAAYGGERTVVHRRDKDVVAIISIEDLHLFERLLEEAEDRIDIQAARAALADPERISFEDVCLNLGLDADVEEAKRPRRAAPRPKAKRAGRQAV